MVYIPALQLLVLVKGNTCGVTWSPVFLPSTVKRACPEMRDTWNRTVPNVELETEPPQVSHRQNITAEICLMKFPILEKRLA